MEENPPLFTSGLRPPHVVGIFIGIAVILGTTLLFIVRKTLYSSEEGSNHPAFQSIVSFSMACTVSYASVIPIKKLYDSESFSDKPDERELFGFWLGVSAFYMQLVWVLTLVFALTISSAQYRKLFWKNVKNLYSMIRHMCRRSKNVVAPAIPLQDVIV